MHNLLRVNDFHSTGNWASRKEADVVSFLFQTACFGQSKEFDIPLDCLGTVSVIIKRLKPCSLMDR